MTGLLVAAAVAVGLALGLVTGRRLSGAGYRLDDETGPLPGPWWWPGAALAAAWGWSAWQVGADAGGAALPAHLLLGWVAVTLSWTDLDVHRLPDGIVYPAYPALAGLLLLATAAAPDPARAWALGGAALMLVGYGAIALAVPAWMGLGDVKVAGLVGLLLGWWGPATLLLGVVLSILLGGIQAAAVILSGRGDRHTEVAYGPALLVGALLAAGSQFQILTGPSGP